jgi:putative ABC transport system ATP-binding protein
LDTVRAVPSPFELSEVTAGPATAPILRSITLTVPCTGITAIAGPSGAGKTSLLRLLDRLDEPLSGDIRWEGRRLADHDPVELRRRVGMVFQRPPVFPGTVHDNLRVAAPSADRSTMIAALERVGLAVGLLERSAADLSGGEAQRMCLARALMTGPEVVLADEPTASLDGAARRTIEELARKLADEGTPMIWISHDVPQLRRLADHVVVLVRGGVAATGTLTELDGHPDPLVRELVGAP